jgi:hydrogenase expression/formation protein HypE
LAPTVILSPLNGESFYPRKTPPEAGLLFLKQARGKLDPNTLTRIVFHQLGAHDDRVLVGPRIGEDAAIIQNDGKVLVIHSDPVTGAEQDLGRLAIHVSVNDVVAKGADPRWISLVLLLDSRVDLIAIRRIARQAHQACLEVGATIVGGHTEVTPIVRRSVIVSTVVGEAKAGSFFTSAGAHPGDRIVMTKSAALEGTWLLANQIPRLAQMVGEKIVKKALSLREKISIYPEARVGREMPGVTAMHDVTEGGVLCAVQEIASASGCGFRLDSSRVAIAEETQRICSALSIDPLKTIGSGSLIITAKASCAGELIERLDEQGILATDIGQITKSGQWLHEGKEERRIRGFVREEIWKVIPG